MVMFKRSFKAAEEGRTFYQVGLLIKFKDHERGQPLILVPSVPQVLSYSVSSPVFVLALAITMLARHACGDGGG